jgi:Family of unknown function (DUF5333)
MLRTGAFGVMLAVGLAAPLAANVRLENEPELGPKVLAVAMAEEIAGNCKSLKLNRPVMSAMAIYFAIGEPSYSVAAHQALIAKGAVEGKPKSYCAVGKAEKRANTVIGRLFR